MNNNLENIMITYNTVTSTNETTNDIEYQQALEMEQNIKSIYGKIDQNTFFIVIFTLVLISMIFEGLLKFVKNQIKLKKEENKGDTKYHKAMKIIIALYVLFLVIFFIVLKVSLLIPIEIIIALEIASIFLVLVNTFFQFKMLLPKIFKK